MIPARTRFSALCLAAALGFVAALWGTAALAQTVQPAGSVIDRVVAVVQIRTGVGARSDSDSARLPAEVITLSGLEFEARVALMRLLDRTTDIRISEEHHGPAGARRYTYVPTYILRGLTELHLEFDLA